MHIEVKAYLKYNPVKAKLTEAVRIAASRNAHIIKNGAARIAEQSFGEYQERKALLGGKTAEGQNVFDEWSVKGLWGSHENIPELIAKEIVGVNYGNEATYVTLEYGDLSGAGNLDKQSWFEYRRANPNDYFFKFLPNGWKPPAIGSRRKGRKRNYYDNTIRKVNPDFITPIGVNRGLMSAVEYGGTWLVTPSADRDYLMPQARGSKIITKAVYKTIKPIRPYGRTMSKGSSVRRDFIHNIILDIRSWYRTGAMFE